MRILILILCIVITSCAGSKKVLTADEITDFKQIVENEYLEVNADFAQSYSLNVGVTGIQNLMPPGSSVDFINLIDNPNFFIIKKDSLIADLPYYGQAQMTAGYNTSSGIEFNDKATSIRKEFKPKKNAYSIRYVIDGQNENYTIFLTLYANNVSNLVIHSSRRSSIVFNGKWKVLEKEKE